MSKSAKIFKKQNLFKAIKVGSSYLWKYMTGKPVIFNLNFNVTNVCNQNCPMCNAVITDSPNAQMIDFDHFKKYIDKFSKYKIASLTISGGEASIVQEIPQMLDYAAGKFPYGVNINSNLFANEKIITKFATAALRNNFRIGTSFDGFGEVADKLRGAKDVEKKVLENIHLVSKLKKEMNSSSTLNMHTVISDTNVKMIPDIIDLSEKLGWTQTLAPINNFFYQDPVHPDTPYLHYSEDLEKAVAYALTKKHVSVSKTFLKNFTKFTKSETPKLCPYLTKSFKTYKVFLDPNGDVSLCSRNPIGNINTDSIEEIVKTDKYKKDINSYWKCQGCWIACFVEILVAMPKWYQKRVIKKLNKNKTFNW